MATLIPPSKDPYVGRFLAEGKYELVALKSTGSGGRVYEGKHAALGRRVTVKILHGSHGSEPVIVSRFHREAQAASRIRHPNVVEILDFGQERDGLLYIIMEYLDGKDLQSSVLHDGAFTLERTLEVGSQLCAAVGAAHAVGIVHRDLRPENILLHRQEDDEGNITEVVKVMDFGIAKFDDRNPANTMEMVSGTPEFMSPEQCRAQPLDSRSDVYAAGCILYFISTGTLPFSGPSAVAVVLKQVSEPATPPSQVNPDLPAEFDSLVLRALSKDPELRQQDARQLRTGLVELRAAPTRTTIPPAPPTVTDNGVPIAQPLTTQPTSGRPSPLPARPPARQRPKRGVLIGVGGALLAFGFAMGFVLLSRDGSDDERNAERNQGTSTESVGSVAVAAEPTNPSLEQGRPADSRAITRDTKRFVDANRDDRDNVDADNRSNRRQRAGRWRVARQRSGLTEAEPEPRSSDEDASPPAVATASTAEAAPAAASPAPLPTQETQPALPAASASPQPPPVAITPQRETSVPTQTSAPGPLRATPRIAAFEVEGSLATSIIRRAVQDRVTPVLAPCYAASAQRAGRNATDHVRVEFEIDEVGRAKSVQVRGATLPGLNQCIANAVQRVVSSQRPDVGTVHTTFGVLYEPERR